MNDTTNRIAPERHALYGASSADRWINCPASMPMSRLLPSLPPNNAMKSGAELHQRAAEYLVGACVDEPDIDENVNAYCKDIAKFRKDGARIWIEHHVELDDDCFTSIDCLIVADNTMWVIDLKTGNNPVSPDGWQNKMGAVLAYEESKATANTANITHVALGIHQFGKLHITLYPIAALREWKLTIEAAARQSKYGTDLKPNAGEWCKYCPCATHCPAKRHVANVAVANKNLPLAQLSVEQLAQIMDLKDEVTSWFGAVESYVTELATKNEMPGYAIVDGRKKPMQWTDKAKDATLPDAYYKRELMTPTQCAKLLGKDGEDLLIKDELVVRPAPNKVLAKVP